MTLEEALRLFPPDGAPLTLVADSPAKYRAASQVIADSFRQLWAEHLAVVRSVNSMSAGAIEGENFSLVRTTDIHAAKAVVDKLYGR